MGKNEAGEANEAPSEAGGPLPAATPAPLTEREAGHLFAAGAAAFHTGTGSGSSRRAWQPPPVEELQGALPQYEIIRLIARGGMGAVYQGVQRSLSRPVAIKVLPKEVAADDLGFAERFVHEARAMARLSHPSIVAVHEAGEAAGGLLFFVMEFVEGQDVGRMVAQQGRLKPAQAAEIAATVCEALSFAHEEGLVHRDIKPSNIIIDNRGRVKVADFGLAKAVHADATLLTLSDMALGTPDFVAPELLSPGMPVDARADLYALGVTLYQMVTGAIPRGRFQLPSRLVPGLSPLFDRIVDKALQPNPEERYPSATVMRADLEAAAQHAVRTPLPALAPVRTPGFWMGATAALVLAVAAGAVGWIFFEGDKGPRHKTAKRKARPPASATGTAAKKAETSPNAENFGRPRRESPEWKAFAAWRNRTHKPGKLRAAGTALNGRPFDLSAAEPFADFVQVLVLEESNNPRRTWVALRANGKAIWADGSYTTGHAALVRNWKHVAAITTYGAVQLEDLPAPPVPVMNFAFGRLQYLENKPFVAAYEDTNGSWFVNSPALNAGLMPPELSPQPKIIKVVVDHAGVGVLRADGSLRIWNQQEMKLPPRLGQKIRDVQPMGSSWSVLTHDGRVVNFSVLTGAAALSEPTTIREFLDAGETAVALGTAGYAPLVRHADGRWTTHPRLTVINETLDHLHQQGNESFSAFSSNNVEGILWIEPVEQPEI